MYTHRMNGTAPALDVGRIGRCYESEEERQALDESTCCAKETSQPLSEEKQAIARHEDLKSKIERDVIALNSLAPIKRLSDDVLFYIFELLCNDSLPVTLPLNHQSWSEPAPPQITLSHVCSAWREIMRDVPTFWSSIRIVLKNFDSSQTFDSVLRAANSWLSRAKGLPCSIDIDFSEDDESWASQRRRLPWENNRHKNIIKDLISLHKFKKLGVTFADRHLRDLLQLPDNKLSCIEDLCLRHISLNDTTSPLDLHKFSNLTSFSLLPFGFYSLRKDYSKFAGIPWHNLRHIQLRATMPATFCLDVLEHCSTVLETCSLVITRDHTFTSSPRPVQLFQLRELRVDVCPHSGDEELLELFLISLRLPRLKSLTLGPYSSSRRHRIGDDVSMLLRVQNATRMHLEELILSESTLRIEARTLLTGFPSLRRLVLPNTVSFTDEAMIEVGTGFIGVFLEDLTITEPDLNLKKLLQMVKARSRAGDRHRIEANEFKCVTLYCSDAEGNMKDDVRGLIDEIKRSGVELNVVFTPWNYSDWDESRRQANPHLLHAYYSAMYSDFAW